MEWVDQIPPVKFAYHRPKQWDVDIEELRKHPTRIAVLKRGDATSLNATAYHLRQRFGHEGYEFTVRSEDGTGSLYGWFAGPPGL